jgi:hypothetical protein
MTKQEAKAFLARNPRVDLNKVRALTADFKLERFWDFASVENKQDACIDLLEVCRALEDKP